MSISFVLISFLMELGAGMMATVSFIPTATVDRRFFKTISFYAALFTCSALLLSHYSTFRLAAPFLIPTDLENIQERVKRIAFLFGVLNLLLWGGLRFTERRLGRLPFIAIGLVGLIMVWVESLLFCAAAGPRWVQQILIPLHFLSSSMILGGFLAGMIFGHWYLVNTEMPKRLLLTMAWILIGVLGLRFLAVGTTLGLYRWVVTPNSDFLTHLISFEGHGIFFWQRVLIGLAIPTGVVAMIWNTARIGANQSATGIMYVGIAFIFIGELAARYLFLLSAIPL